MTVTFDDRTTVLRCNKCRKTVAEIKYSWDLYEGFDKFDIICENCKNKQEIKPKLCYCGNIPRTKCKECHSPICMIHI
jgi:hypothetical protein